MLFDARVFVAREVWRAFLEAAHAKLGYRLTDQMLQDMTGHNGTTIKTALGLKHAKGPPKNCRTLTDVEKFMRKYKASDYGTLAVDLRAAQIKKGRQVAGGADGARLITTLIRPAAIASSIHGDGMAMNRASSTRHNGADCDDATISK